MFRNSKNKLDIGEYLRLAKRILDGNLTYKKIFIILLIFTFVFLYLGSSIFRFLFSSRPEIKDPLERCMDDRLTPFYRAHSEYNAHIRHNPKLHDENNFVPYVGSGYFGLEVQYDAYMNVKSRRSLKLPIFFHPLVSLSQLNGEFRQATVVEYLNGIVHRFQYFKDYFVSYQYYAHRNMPSIFVQEIEITNTKNQLMDVDLTLPRISDWPGATTRDIKMQHGSINVDYQVVSGPIKENPDSDDVMVVSIVTRKLLRSLTLKKRGITKLAVLMSIYYSCPVQISKYDEKKTETEKFAVDAIRNAQQDADRDVDTMSHNFRKQHIRVWNNLWATGFDISTSKAENGINGDRINATIYAVLSQTRTYEFEESITPQREQDIARALTYAEGCYDSYHTLQAENLWLDMGTLDDLNNLVSSWILTLEKQGCHHLLRAGASGIIQAMVLSFGSFRFSNQHLEFNIHPKFLHREYHFRRLNYGNMTPVNVTISVTDENKAVIHVVLDRSDRKYYACDAGCLDEPIMLGPTKKIFPVKLTEPITAISDITADEQHMEEQR